MSKIHQKIKENYLDDRWDNSTLISVLNNLDNIQLQVVMNRIKEVEAEHGDCKLRRVNETSSYLSVSTDHPDDPGVTFAASVYR